MDRKSKILFTVMTVLCILSIAALFYKAVILQDFTIVKVYKSADATDTVTDTEIVTE